MTQVTAIDAYWLGKVELRFRGMRSLLTVVQLSWDLCFTQSGRRTSTMVVQDAGLTASSRRKPS